MPKRAQDPTDVFVGVKLRHYRLKKGWSQTDLGGYLNLTFQQVQKYEKGSNRIGAGRLSKIARLLEVPVTAFFPTSDSPHEEIAMVQLADTALAMRLLTAFNALESPSARQALTKIAEELGGTTQVRKRRAA